MSPRRFVPVLVSAAVLLPALPAAALPLKDFGPVVDRYQPYVGQRRCSPWARPGAKSLRRIVMRSYPNTRSYGIVRACDIGGMSEHKEGRAWDWGVRAGIRSERRAASRVLNWLLATDAHGNPHARARRFGLMYIIWNRQIWSTWSRGWSVYCVQKRNACRNADGEKRHPHDDHVHFSFSWPGARKETTWWNPERSYPVPEPTP